MSEPPAPAETDVAAIPELVRGARAAFDAGTTRDLAWRERQLEAIARLCQAERPRIEAALAADLGKPSFEAAIAEICYTRSEALGARRQLRSWAADEPVGTPLGLQPARSWLQRDPLGAVLIIAPWNYPFALVTAPLIGALAAGNAAVVKPSEVSAATSALLAELLPRYLDADAVRVVEGGVPQTQALLAERFDHIFYTGNGTVGRIVMRAAAEHLTPVTLELGGKSPCIVDASADLALAARRICWGKFWNAGQTCVAPDYVLVEAGREQALLDALKDRVKACYGDDPASSPDYGRIVNTRHHDRLTAMLGGGRAVTGGGHDREARYLAPTVLTEVDLEGPLMAEEIFGPLLPVIPVADLDAAIAFVNARPRPLALYAFSRSGANQRAVLQRTTSGGAAVNHTWLHLANPELPFGGVGPSGTGAYHGRHSFETFSHTKGVMRKAGWFDPDLMYPPYSASKQGWMERIV